jgi:hypothetical protein
VTIHMGAGPPSAPSSRRLSELPLLCALLGGAGAGGAGAGEEDGKLATTLTFIAEPPLQQQKVVWPPERDASLSADAPAEGYARPSERRHLREKGARARSKEQRISPWAQLEDANSYGKDTVERRSRSRRRLATANMYQGEGGIPASMATQMCQCDESTSTVELGGSLSEVTVAGLQSCPSHLALNALDTFPRWLFTPDRIVNSESKYLLGFGQSMAGLFDGVINEEQCLIDPIPGKLGSFNVPDLADFPYVHYVFADGQQPLTSVMKVMLSESGLVEAFREWKENLGLARDAQLAPEIALYGVRPFFCTYPATPQGCREVGKPRAILDMVIDEIDFAKLARTL